MTIPSFSVRCWFGWHEEAVRDRVDGVQVLRCPRCWHARPYPETTVDALAAERRRQAQSIACFTAAREEAIRERENRKRAHLVEAPDGR